MMRCPMCRNAMDRHDLANMGCQVSPSRLQLAQQRCEGLKALEFGPESGARPPDRTDGSMMPIHDVRNSAQLETSFTGISYPNKVL